MKKVRVAPGYSQVPLLGRYVNFGETVTLTDAQFEELPAFITEQLVVVQSRPDLVAPVSTPSPTPATGPSYTDQLFQSQLARLSTPYYLVWDGIDYQPKIYKSSLDRPKVFVGPTDPRTMGATLAVRDQWIDF